MEHEINERDEGLSDSQSSSSPRPSSAASSDMFGKSNLPIRSNAFIRRQPSLPDTNEIPSSPTKQNDKELTPIKVLVFSGKCSKLFKSTLEDCVEDCLLEFPADKSSVYVPKIGQAIPVPVGSSQNSILSLRNQCNSGRQSGKSNRRRSSNLQYNNTLPAISGVPRTNNLASLSTAALAAAATSRIRQSFIQQRFSIVEDISEETSEQHTTIEQQPIITTIDGERQADRPSVSLEEHVSSVPNPNMVSMSLPSFPFATNLRAKTRQSYRDRQKNYRLSDLVMLGPEYYTQVFNLPRQRPKKTPGKLTELDRIKKDLFHRYLWTQKPQVSCRILPFSTYDRSHTFVT